MSANQNADTINFTSEKNRTANQNADTANFTSEKHRMQ